MATQPLITIRQYTTPFPVLSSLTYVQTTPGGSSLPVLQGTDSDPLYLRFYNNYGLAASIATAINCFVTTYDGVGTGSHTASIPVVSQTWIHILENGYGEGSTTPGAYTVYAGSDTAVGGLRQYVFDKGSDGSAGISQIRAYSTQGGCGFVELKSYARVPANAANVTSTFAVSLGYEWVS